MHDLSRCNELVSQFEACIAQPNTQVTTKLYTGIDLGTAYIVLAVLDAEGQPVAGAWEAASVVRDGMVVDYVGAVDIVKKLKAELEEKLGQELVLAAAAIPPQTAHIDGGVVKNVAQAAGFVVNTIVDEPSAANELISLHHGAVVDIGGGTTGISILKDAKLVHVVDEPSGGRHFNLVLAGARGIREEEAEQIKLDAANHAEIFPVLSPVIDKIGSIVSSALQGWEVESIVLVGGSSCLTHIEDRLSQILGIEVCKPHNPLFVTPLGIALSCLNAESEEGEI